MRIVKVPLSKTASGAVPGCEIAPDALCAGFLCDEATASGIGPEKGMGMIFSRASELVRERPLFVGGDHSITYGTFGAFAAEFSAPAFISFDAHANAMPAQNGGAYENPDREIIEHGLLDGRRAAIIGVRRTAPEEEAFIKSNDVSSITAAEVRKNINDYRGFLTDFLSKQKNIYVSFDIDVLDPAIAPGTRRQEKNGISHEDAAALLGIIIGSGKMRAFDLVEVNPSLDRQGKTIAAGKKIIQKLFAEW